MTAAPAAFSVEQEQHDYWDRFKTNVRTGNLGSAPVIAASQPILIGSDWAIAGFGNDNVVAPRIPALPNNTSRREMVM